MSSATILKLEDYRQRPSEETALLTAVVDATVVTDRSAGFDDVYAPEGAGAAVTLRLRQALLESLALLNHARTEDVMAKDDAISRLKIAIAQLFTVSGTTRGFQSVIVGLHHALRNKRGEPLSEAQFYCVLSMISTLSSSPHIAFEKGLDLLDKLEDAGFKIAPAEGALLYGLLNE